MDWRRPHLTPKVADFRTLDTFQNFLTGIGLGAGNASTGGRYGYNPISSIPLQLEWAYRGSWVIGKVVDCHAEDMTREGVTIQTDDPPEMITELETYIDQMQIWPTMCFGEILGRLYGGAIGYLMIDGQDPETPLNVDTVRKDQFKGIFTMDRWQVQPSMDDLVGDKGAREWGPKVGLPRWYDYMATYGSGMGSMRMHHSRVIRFMGIKLPWRQAISQMYWGQSVVERMWDRLLAFDSATIGAAQMAYKCYLRTLKVDNLRSMIANNQVALKGVTGQVEFMRQMQSNEGITLLDKTDEFDVQTYNFAGLDSILESLADQVAGAADTPMERMFGRSPGGLNASGDSGFRNYYDNLKGKQKTKFSPAVGVIYPLAYASKFGKAPPKFFQTPFKPLWQMSKVEEADVTDKTVGSVLEAYEGGLISRSGAMKELRQLATITGAFSNITDEDIDHAEEQDKDARENPPNPADLGIGPDGRPLAPKPGAPAAGGPAAQARSGGARAGQ